MIELKVVTVTNNLELCPEFAKDTANYPWLVKYIEDEQKTFVVEPKTKRFWEANEFLLMKPFTSIFVNPEELEG